MDDQCRNGGRNGPQADMQRFDPLDPVLFQERINQQYRAKGDKNIFPKENRDIVTRGGMGFDFVADSLRQFPVFIQSGPSAIGASSGRTVCAWPPSDIRPSTAVPSRATK